MSYTLIATVTVGAGGAASIDFTSIPQTYTDLMLVCSTRITASSFGGDTGIKINGTTTNYSGRMLVGDGSATSSQTTTSSYRFGGFTEGSTATSNVFASTNFYIPNYTGSTNKTISIDTVTESAVNNGYQGIQATLWSNTAAITSLTLLDTGGTNFVQYSTASLYGIK